MAEAARAWGTTPSALIGLPAGTVEQLDLDVQLARVAPRLEAARRLGMLLPGLEEDGEEPEQPMVPGDPFSAVPSWIGDL